MANNNLPKHCDDEQFPPLKNKKKLSRRTLTVCGQRLRLRLKTRDWLREVRDEVELCTANTVPLCDTTTAAGAGDDDDEDGISGDEEEDNNYASGGADQSGDTAASGGAYSYGRCFVLVFFLQCNIDCPTKTVHGITVHTSLLPLHSTKQVRPAPAPIPTTIASAFRAAAPPAIGPSRRSDRPHRRRHVRRCRWAASGRRPPRPSTDRRRRSSSRGRASSIWTSWRIYSTSTSSRCSR